VTGYSTERKFYHNYGKHGFICEKTKDSQDVVHADVQYNGLIQEMSE
jgi:hypothetical protein